MNDIAFVSTCFGKFGIDEYYEYVFPTVNEYCHDRDFDFHLYEKNLDDNRDPQWTKILAIQKHISNYDWVIWIDADIMIMNHMINIRDYINQNYNLIITEFVKPHLYNINTGLLYLKGKNEWTENFLEEVYYGDNVFVNNPTKVYHEQSSMGVFFEKNDVEDKVLIRKPTLHKKWPLFFPDTKDLLLHPEDGEVQTWLKRHREGYYFKKGDFTAHVLGRDMEERAKIYELLSNHVLWHE